MTFQKMAAAVLKRSGGACEAPGCEGPDFRGVMLAHITHRKMGGRHGHMEEVVNDPRNVAMLCGVHHDILDGRDWKPLEQPKLQAYLAKKIGWDEWNKEHFGKN